MKKFYVFACAILSAATCTPLAACGGEEESNLTAYDIRAEYDGANTLSVVCDANYYNDTEDEIAVLPFNLWGNAYREGAEYSPLENSDSAYYSGASYGGMTIGGVTGCSAFEVGGEDENILLVTLTEPIFPGERAEICISFTLTLAEVNHRTGVSETGVNLGNFFPIVCARSTDGFIQTPYYSTGDPFVSECANFSVELTLPKGYVAATSGKETGKAASDGGVTHTYSLSSARDFAAVLYKDAETITRDVCGVELSLYYCGDTPPETLFNAAAESFEYFYETFGKYPYPTLSLCSTSLSVSGMEYPALVMIESGLSESEGIYTAVHETAHQWWYAAVGNDQVSNGWQDEGLAEYSALCFFENNPAYGYTRTALLGSAIKAYRSYYSVYSQLFGDADTAMRRSLADFAGEYEYVNIAYNKGLLLFESLRRAMGDEKFFSSLKSYYADNMYKIASPEELCAHFAAKYDVEGIFASYVNGKVVI